MMRPLPLKFLLISILFSAIAGQAAVPQAFQKAKQNSISDSQLIDIPKEMPASGLTSEPGTVALKSENVSQAHTDKALLADRCRIYPVPATSELTVSGIENASVLEIFDVTGNKIISEQCEGMDIKTLNISHLARGIYFVRLTTPLGGVMKRFVKE